MLARPSAVVRRVVACSLLRSAPSRERLRFEGENSINNGPEPNGMTLTERTAGDVVIVDVVGTILASERGPRLEDTVAGLARRGLTRVVLNLAGAAYMDSAGLGDFIQAYAVMQRAGGVIRLLHVSPRVQHVLAITRLLGLFESFDDEAMAVSSFDARSARQLVSSRIPAPALL